MPAVTALVAVGCGLLGLLVGSFLNVVVHRVPRKESVIRPRSSCPGCGTELANRDNIPVLSWLLLRGRCRTCGGAIAARYPLVEVLTAAVFAVLGARFGADAALPAFLVLGASLLAISVIDLEHFLVPNRILIATLAVGAPLLLVAGLTEREPSDLVGAGLGAVVAFLFLLVINLVYPRGMGMGDVKLAFVLGLYLGFLDLGHVFLGLFLGFLLGSAGGIALIASGLRTRRDHIPFAPFLAVGALFAVVFGEPILDWYGG